MTVGGIMLINGTVCFNLPGLSNWWNKVSCTSSMSTRINQCYSARQDPTGSKFALTAEPRVTYQTLENKMNLKKMIVVVTVLAAAGSAFAQQSEFVAPDAAFTANLTRAEVRQDLAQPGSQATLAQRRHDGQDTTFAASGRSRQDVRAEVLRSVQSRRAGDVNSLYFGA
jgi:hypothetical protein